MRKERATMTEEPPDDASGDRISYGRRQRRWRKLRTMAVATEEVRHHGQRKLQMCLSMMEKVAVLSLGVGRSCTQKQQWQRELHMKAIVARASDPSVNGRGSVGLVRRQQLHTKATARLWQRST